MKKTALNKWHKKNANMGTFANWKLAIKYSGIKEEHLTVRNSVGIFDISHMGRIKIKGPDSTLFLNRVLTRNIKKINENDCLYSLICNKQGGIKDDIILYKISDELYWIICNSSNRKKINNWLDKIKNNYENLFSEKKLLNIQIKDKTFDTILFAIQGPNSKSVLSKIIENLPKEKYTHNKTKVLGLESIISSTGYTGEKGFEIMPLKIKNEPSSKIAIELWKLILNTGREFGIKPCGLGARDSLRIEAGLCLYGQDISEKINPFEAGLEFAINLKKQDFIGKVKLKEEKNKEDRKRVGFVLEKSGVPRNGDKIKKGNKKIGEVTSGTYSPVLKKGIGMGYIKTKHKKSDSIKIKIRGKEKGAKITKMPFIS